MSPQFVILSDSSQYDVGREFAAVATGDGRSSATDRHIVLSGSIRVWDAWGRSQTGPFDAFSL